VSRAPAPTLRLLADDLTGALDTAAEFVGVSGPIPVYWTQPAARDLPASAALDSGTRELPEAEAVAVVGELARALERGGIAYKKVDSLLRGHTLPELAACFRRGAWRHCVFAPAFPHQERITRGGRQFARRDGDWAPVSGDLVAGIAATGVPVQRGRCDRELAPGIGVFDAETDTDLDRIVAIGRRASAPVLWCGSGGLAGALARGTDPVAPAVLHPPVLGLFGSDQPATARQLAACGRHWLKLPDGGPASAAKLEGRLRAGGVALASFDLPAGISREEAGERIRRYVAALTSGSDAPRTVVVAGGETLRALCTVLGAEALEVRGRIEPGVPRSVMRGGRWNGVDVVSKSGAFGRPDLWRELLQRSGLT
jgi:uncharacterized protein YgbK (DUF1537 family)